MTWNIALFQNPRVVTVDSVHSHARSAQTRTHQIRLVIQKGNECEQDVVSSFGIRLAGLRFENECTTWHEGRVDTLEEPFQANIATIQMYPLGYREPNSMQLSVTRYTIDAERSHGDDVITRVILRDVLVHPVSAAESNVVRKFMFRCVQVERVRRLNRKPTKHVVARCREVIGHRWCKRER
jgi:hypothetical protein